MQSYYPISQYYQRRFGEKVYKIPVTISDRCPTLADGHPPCIFCDAWGSSARPELNSLELMEQIEIQKKIIQKRYKAKRFLVYFQTYTSTFLALRKLESCLKTALTCADVCGIVIGTRPDCVSEGVLRLWDALAQENFVSVELGVQSFFDSDLNFLRRGHRVQHSFDAIERIGALSNIDLGIHLILGLPGETEEKVISTAKIVSELPIQNVKLHNLNVINGTRLAELFKKGGFQPIELETYVKHVILLLRHLPTHVAIHRLSAVVAQWDELLAPEWGKHKFRIAQRILDCMQEVAAVQGDLEGRDQ